MPDNDGFGKVRPITGGKAARKQDPEPKSPLTNTPFLLPGSRGGIRERLPATWVPPETVAAIERVLATKRFGAFTAPTDIVRWCQNAGLNELQTMLDDPEFAQLLSVAQSREKLEHLRDHRKLVRETIVMAEELVYDRRATALEIQEALQAIRDVMLSTVDPEHLARLQGVIDKIEEL